MLAMSTATDMRDAYLAAERAVLKGQSVRLGERMVSRADLPEIIRGRKEWELRVLAETRAAAGQRGDVALADFRGCR